MKIITLETKGRYVTVHPPPPCAVIGRVGWGGATPWGLWRGVVYPCHNTARWYCTLYTEREDHRVRAEKRIGGLSHAVTSFWLTVIWVDFDFTNVIRFLFVDSVCGSKKFGSDNSIFYKLLRLMIDVLVQWTQTYYLIA